jgi:hypothetical protein
VQLTPNQQPGLALTKSPAAVVEFVMDSELSHNCLAPAISPDYALSFCPVPVAVAVDRTPGMALEEG